MSYLRQLYYAARLGRIVGLSIRDYRQSIERREQAQRLANIEATLLEQQQRERKLPLVLPPPLPRVPVGMVNERGDNRA